MPIAPSTYYAHVARRADPDKQLLCREELCIVDACLPDRKGVETVMRRLSKEAVPVIIISGVYTELPDRILGLELGADDFLLKPFSARELIARTKAVLRRTSKRADEVSGEIFFAD